MGGGILTSAIDIVVLEIVAHFDPMGGAVGCGSARIMARMLVDRGVFETKCDVEISHKMEVAE